MSERVARFDRGTLRSPRRTDQGRLRVDGVFTRAGVFEYVDKSMPNGVRRELRPPEEVFRADVLARLEAIPVVEDHPTRGDGLLRDDSGRAQGWTLEGVRRDGDFVVGSMLVTDAGLIRKIEGGKDALSVGYEITYDATPGNDLTYGRYDGVQRDIRADHLAVVDSGRAGPEARIRMDSADATSVPEHLTTGGPSPMLRDEHSFRDERHCMNPKDIEKLQEALADAKSRADAAEKALTEAAKRADAAEGKAEALEAEAVKLRAARVDAAEVTKLEAQVVALGAQVESERKLRKDAEDPARFQSAVRERVRIESAAGSILGEKFRRDAGNRELMIATLEKVQGPVDAKRSDEYIAARFDSAVDAWTAGESALRGMAEQAVTRVEQRLDSRSAREKMIAERATLTPIDQLK